MTENNYCVIMAGGVGSRFWPLSRKAKPKQFLDILGTGRTLLQQTYDRFQTICPSENFLVVTSEEYVDIAREQLPDVPPENILGEPARRNTAPCIAYATYKIKSKNPQANMVVTPADHLVLYVEQFRETITKTLQFVENNDVLATIGIKPTRPETGYGYIQLNNKIKDEKTGIYKVETFTEKPNLEMAKVFLQSGEFMWNAGIFISSVEAMSSALGKYLSDVDYLFNPKVNGGVDVYNTPDEIEFIKKVYSAVISISIDYGVMEKAENVYVMPADFGWSDLGTWSSLYDYSKKDEHGNALNSDNVLVVDTKNSIISAPNNRLVVVNNLENAIVVEADGILFISGSIEEKKIRDIVKKIKEEKGEEFL